jgi:hypothetical protein
VRRMDLARPMRIRIRVGLVVLLCALFSACGGGGGGDAAASLPCQAYPNGYCSCPGGAPEPNAIFAQGTPKAVARCDEESVSSATKVSCCGGTAPCNCLDWICQADPTSSVPCLCQFDVRHSGTNYGTSCVPDGAPLATPGGLSGGKDCCSIGGDLGTCACSVADCQPGEQPVAACDAQVAGHYSQCNLPTAPSCSP